MLAPCRARGARHNEHVANNRHCRRGCRAIVAESRSIRKTALQQRRENSWHIRKSACWPFSWRPRRPRRCPHSRSRRHDCTNMTSTRQASRFPALPRARTWRSSSASPIRRASRVSACSRAYRTTACARRRQQQPLQDKSNARRRDQAEFVSREQGMDEVAWLYVPPACDAGAVCRLHVFLHSCGHSYSSEATTGLPSTRAIRAGRRRTTSSCSSRRRIGIKTAIRPDVGTTKDGLARNTTGRAARRSRPSWRWSSGSRTGSRRVRRRSNTTMRRSTTTSSGRVGDEIAAWTLASSRVDAHRPEHRCASRRNGGHDRRVSLLQRRPLRTGELALVHVGCERVPGVHDESRSGNTRDSRLRSGPPMRRVNAPRAVPLFRRDNRARAACRSTVHDECIHSQRDDRVRLGAGGQRRRCYRLRASISVVRTATSSCAATVTGRDRAGAARPG